MTDELTPSLAGRQPFNVRCGKCRHVWPAAWLPMEASLFAKVAKDVHCPACGHGPKGIVVAIGAAPTPAPAQRTS